MSRSIIQCDKECFLCRQKYMNPPHRDLHRHHIMHGPFRKKAEHYGLWVYVCNEEHHEYGPESPHGNAEVDRRLKRIAQCVFEERFGHEKWMQEFGRNYLE